MLLPLFIKPFPQSLEPPITKDIILPNTFRDYSFIMIDGGFAELVSNTKGTYGSFAYNRHGNFVFMGARNSQAKSTDEGVLLATYCSFAKRLLICFCVDGQSSQC